jgi:fumarate reductase subunit D
MVGTILVILLVLMLLGVLPAWNHSQSWAYFPSGAVGAILIVVVVLAVLGRI